MSDIVDLTEVLSTLEKLREVTPNSNLEREILREKAIQALKGKVSSPGRLVDAALVSPRKDQGAHRSGLQLVEPEPWEEPVDGAELVTALISVIERYVALPTHAPITIAIWVIFTHSLDAFDVSPILALASPEKRCGKTTLLLLLRRLSYKPLLASNISPAALFRTVEKYRPSLLIDEADTHLKQSEELRGIINSGHTRDSAYVVRTIGDDYEPKLFSTWSPKAIALIGNLPDTIEDRSIRIPMRRRAPGETIERLRTGRHEELERLQRQCARWARDHLDELRVSDPLIPAQLHDRAADNYRPLLAIAELISAALAERTRQAAIYLCGETDGDDESVRTLLLCDLRQVFGEPDQPALPSKEIIEELLKLEDRPWGRWHKGNPLSVHGLARLLKPFKVRPKQIWINGAKNRGYELEDFKDTFRRYLPPESVDPVEHNSDGLSQEIRGRYDPSPPTESESLENPITTGILPGLPDGDGGQRRLRASAPKLAASDFHYSLEDVEPELADLDEMDQSIIQGWKLDYRARGLSHSDARRAAYQSLISCSNADLRGELRSTLAAPSSRAPPDTTPELSLLSKSNQETKARTSRHDSADNKEKSE